MTIVGLDYGYAGQMGVDEVQGGAPYGATTLADGDGSRQPSSRSRQCPLSGDASRKPRRSSRPDPDAPSAEPLSPGSPMMALEPSPAQDFLAGLGCSRCRVRGRSWSSRRITTHSSKAAGRRSPLRPRRRRSMISANFPDFSTCAMPHQAIPALAQRVVDLLADQGLAVAADPDRGLDHGAGCPVAGLSQGRYSGGAAFDRLACAADGVRWAVHSRRFAMRACC